jgi:NifU-like protein involved in Fe-S cluster formation
VFSRLAREHIANPRNRGSLPLATTQGSSHYPECGDRFQLYLRIETDRIQEASFEAQGCGHVLVMGSIGTEAVTGITIDQAKKITAFEWDQRVGGFPPAKRHAILMFMESLHQALGAAQL